ncbi:MAG: L-threonylcarbamoyladenylate synthase [Atopobiaceae bacterium]
MGAVVSVSQDKPAIDVVSRAAFCLTNQGVLVMPTDSVYGIGCAALPNNPAHLRIFEIKHRDVAQTLPWLVADVNDLDRYGVDVPAWAHAMARQFWPGALTLVVKASPEVPPEYRRQGDQTIALRCPDSNLVRTLARMVGVPLATTSANTHGAPSATSGSSVEPRIVQEANLTLDAGPAPLAVASTIVDCTSDRPRILREGAIDSAELLRLA